MKWVLAHLLMCWDGAAHEKEHWFGEQKLLKECGKTAAWNVPVRDGISFKRAKGFQCRHVRKNILMKFFPCYAPGPPGDESYIAAMEVARDKCEAWCGNQTNCCACSADCYAPCNCCRWNALEDCAQLVSMGAGLIDGDVTWKLNSTDGSFWCPTSDDATTVPTRPVGAIPSVASRGRALTTNVFAISVFLPAGFLRILSMLVTQTIMSFLP